MLRFSKSVWKHAKIAKFKNFNGTLPSFYSKNSFNGMYSRPYFLSRNPNDEAGSNEDEVNFGEDEVDNLERREGIEEDELVSEELVSEEQEFEKKYQDEDRSLGEEDEGDGRGSVKRALYGRQGKMSDEEFAERLGKDQEKHQQQEEDFNKIHWGKGDYFYIVFITVGGVVMLIFFKMQSISIPFQRRYVKQMGRTLNDGTNKIAVNLASYAYEKGLEYLKASLGGKDKKFTKHWNFENIVKSCLGELQDTGALRYVSGNFLLETTNIMHFMSKNKNKNFKEKQPSSSSLLDNILRIIKAPFPYYTYRETLFSFHFPILNLESNAVSVLKVTLKTTRDPFVSFSKRMRKEEQRNFGLRKRVKKKIRKEEKRGIMTRAREMFRKKKIGEGEESMQEIDAELARLEEELSRTGELDEKELAHYYALIEREEKEDELAKRIERKMKNAKRFEAEDFDVDVDTIEIADPTGLIESISEGGAEFFYQYAPNLRDEEFVVSWPWKGIASVPLLVAEDTPRVKPVWEKGFPTLCQANDILRGFLIPGKEDDDKLPPVTRQFS